MIDSCIPLALCAVVQEEAELAGDLEREWQLVWDSVTDACVM